LEKNEGKSESEKEEAKPLSPSPPSSPSLSLSLSGSEAVSRQERPRELPKPGDRIPIDKFSYRKRTCDSKSPSARIRKIKPL
jgi:hypothetical protein